MYAIDYQPRAGTIVGARHSFTHRSLCVISGGKTANLATSYSDLSVLITSLDSSIYTLYRVCRLYCLLFQGYAVRLQILVLSFAGYTGYRLQVLGLCQAFPDHLCDTHDIMLSS